MWVYVGLCRQTNDAGTVDVWGAIHGNMETNDVGTVGVWEPIYTK